MTLPKVKRTPYITRHLRDFVKRLWPPTPLSAIFIVAAILFCGSVSALVIQYAHANTTASKKTSNVSSGNTNCLIGASGCPNSNNSSTSAPAKKTTTPTSQQATNNNSSKPAATSPAVSCQFEDIPYATTTQYLANLYTTDSYSEPGADGTKEVCSDGTSHVVAPPVNEVHYVGTIDKAAQDLAANHKIVAWCSQNIDGVKPTAYQFESCLETNSNMYNIYGESFIDTLQ